MISTLAQQTKILITGASGYIGGRLVARLHEKGYSLHCLARRPEALQKYLPSSIEVVSGDMLKSESLAPAFVGIDIAYYLVHSMRQSEANFEDKDRQAAKNFADAAKKTGVKRIIYLGGLGQDDHELSPHLQSRHEVGDILRASGIPVTEFRAAIIVGSGSISFEMIRYLTERLPIMICPKWVKSRCQPIAIRDVLNYLIAAIEEPRSVGEILEIGGADILTYKEMMLGYAKVRGLKRALIEVPVLTPRLSSYWVDFITPIPASISRPLILGLKNDVICQNFKAREIFPFKPLGYEEAVRLALAKIEGSQIETIWSGSQASAGSRSAELKTLETREGFIIETRQASIQAKPDTVFKIVSRLGGKQGWYYANSLWHLRGLIDRLFGGVGMRRGRRDPERLRVGDALDFWRVEAIEADKLMRLRAEMKVPGKAWLQFEIQSNEESPKSSILTQSAFFEPKGLSGLLYWYVLYPVHSLIFSGLCREIKKRAELKN